MLTRLWRRPLQRCASAYPAAAWRPPRCAQSAQSFELKPGSVNGGEIDRRAMIDLQPQTVVRNLPGRYCLWRIGDAVAPRNIHASIYEAMRLTLPL
jgi:hypothetical protein